MQPTRLSEITIEKLRNRGLEDVIPELYELEKIIENNRSHNNQPVFEHVLSVLITLKKEFCRASQKTKDYLAKKIDSYSKKQLLFLAAVLHDIGKKETIKKDEDVISFPSHEKVGAEKIKEVLPRFDLSEKEKVMVIEIIRNHGFFHNLLDQRKSLDLNQKISEFREKNSDVFFEIVLLTIADLQGGHLKDNNFQEFNFRVDFLNKIIT